MIHCITIPLYRHRAAIISPQICWFYHFPIKPKKFPSNAEKCSDEPEKKMSHATLVIVISAQKTGDGGEDRAEGGSFAAVVLPCWQTVVNGW